MTKDCFVRLAAVSGVLLAASFAQAQVRVTSGANQTAGISLRIGAFLPTTSAGTNLGSEWLGAGVDYKLNSAAAPNTQMQGMLPTYLSLSLDYYEKNSFTAIPLVLNYNVKTGPLTYAVGIGAQESQFGNGGTSTVSFALQGGATYEFTHRPVPFFIQAKYFYSNYEVFRGVGVFLGVKF